MRKRAAFAALATAALLAAPAARAQECGASPGALGADSLVALGRYWHAERAAPPLPRAPRPVPLQLALLHARIAAGLGRWEDVDAALRRARGADTVPEALAVWAEAAEHLGDWSAAELRDRRLAGLASAPAELRSRALVRRAVALETLGRTDSALAAWRRAAQALPEIGDWLALHRADLERDTVLAFASVAAPRSPGAAQRRGVFLAQRRVREGNLEGALETFRSLQQTLDVARVEETLGRHRLARLRADSVLLSDPTKPQAVLAANFLTALHDTLGVVELAGIARVYRAFNDRAASERYFRLALARADTSVGLWGELAAVLASRREYRAALGAADSAVRHARGVRAIAAAGAVRVAAFAAARRWDEADTVLTRLTASYSGDSSVARAVLQLAEHDRTLVQTPSELRRYALLLRDYAGTPAANVARLRLALFQYAQGDADSAAALLAQALAADPARLLGTTPRYWDARLRLERGDSAAARTTLAAIAAREPLSYYGVRARMLLGNALGFAPDSMIPPPQPGSLPPVRAAERIRLLLAVGLEAEARMEAAGWVSDSMVSIRTLTAAAAAAADAGFAREAILLGEAARSRAGLTAGAALGLLPFPYRGAIEGESEEHCVDPLLLAAIIRQETRFTPRAVSRAGARGIAQVMPATGRDLARRMGIRSWDAELLFVPDFNLHLGVHFLAARLRADSFPLYAAIAAYNAGPQRVDRWRRWPEFRESDLFVERVAIAETRNYVKTVYASYLWYRRAYATPAGAAPAAAAEPSSPASPSP